MRMTNYSPQPRLRSRRGMTLVEMMVVVVLLSIVGGAVMSTLAKQQAFYRSTSDVMDLRSQMRQASAVLANDLRGVASGAGDINSMSEKPRWLFLLSLRAFIGLSSGTYTKHGVSSSGFCLRLPIPLTRP